MTALSHRLAAFLALALLSACAGGTNTPPTDTAPSGPVAGYEGLEDGGFYIEPVDPALLTPAQRRTEVDYAGDEPAGSIVVDIYARRLYHIRENGRAMRYAIAVGREGLSFTGTGVIGRKAEWPSWQPTANMLRTRPDLYAEYAGGRAGGADNPLGSRALYLYRGGRDTYFRIHGTIQNESIGRATSAGCIRMFNQDVIHLYEQVKTGTQVKVRSLAESLAAEGPYMDDALGFAVPNTAENVDALTAAAEAKAKAEAIAAEEQAKADAEAAKQRERADRKRLRECRRKNIDALLCPPLPEDEAPSAAEKQDFVFKPAIRTIDPADKAEADKAEAEKAAAEKAAAEKAAADEEAAKKAEAEKAAAEQAKAEKAAAEKAKAEKAAAEKAKAEKAAAEKAKAEKAAAEKAKAEKAAAEKAAAEKTNAQTTTTTP